ncbi:hypothetical protein ANTRET_LOCUS2520 [Anthophora retusa]
MANPAVVAVIFGVAIATVLYFMFASQEGEHSQRADNRAYRHNYYINRNRRFQQPIDNRDECTICISPLIYENMVELYCHHTFHKKCIEELIQHGQREHVQQLCPLCRAPIKF